MRTLTIIVLIAAAAYSGYWLIGSSSVENGAKSAIVNLQDRGWAVDIADVSTRGFPSRFDTTLTDINVVSPDGASGWTAPFVQALALSYRPNEVILAFPPTHQLRLGGVDVALQTQGLRASAAVAARPSAPLTKLTAELETGTATFSPDTVVGLGKSLLALRETDAPNTYDAYLDLSDVELPSRIANLLPQDADLSSRIAQISLDTKLGLDRPLDRHMSDGPQPQIETLDVNGAIIQWGAASLRAKGALNVDPSGIPTGNLTLTLRNWDGLLDLAVKLGAFPEGVAPTVRRMAGLMAAGSDTLELPLTFQNGTTMLGPFPLGPAPRFR